MNDMIGKTIAHYKIERLVGQGGMASVYEALDTSLQRQVAIKLMHPHLASKPAFQERFAAEARAAASLDHANIVHVLAFSESGNTLYLAMELLEGGSLRQHIKNLRGKSLTMAYPEAIETVRQLAEALDYAHENGMVHRDIKPDNILLKPAPDERLPFRPVITDFGLAQLIRDDTDTAVTDAQPVGTYPYMSPEQTNAVPVDGRGDVYALGIMLYELSVGRLPFTPRNIAEAASMHNTQPVPLPTALNPQFPPELERVILRCLAKNPDNRYQTAGELAADLGTLHKPVASVIDGGAASLDMMVADEEYTTALKTAHMNAPLAEEVPFDPPTISNEDRQVDNLVVYQQEGTRIFPLLQETGIIGREAFFSYELPDEHLSRQHVQIERKPTGKYVITDLGSLNGTWLNDERLIPNVPAIMQPNATLRVGPYWAQIIPALAPIIAEDPDDPELELNRMASSMLLDSFGTEGSSMSVDTMMMGMPPEDQIPERIPPSLTPEQMETNRLIIYHPGEAPVLHLLTENRYYVGRSPRNDIKLESDFVSRVHARLDLRHDGWAITNVGALNGVWLDNEQIPPRVPTRLREGRVIRIGDYWLEFEMQRDIMAAGSVEDHADDFDTAHMVKPLSEEMDYYSPPPLSREAQAQDRLFFFSPDHGPKMVPITQNMLTIGRGSDVDVRLRGRRVSREHGRLEFRQDGTIYYTDTNATNGTWMGDTLLVPQTQVLWLRNEVIRIGNYWLKYERGTDPRFLPPSENEQDPYGLIGNIIEHYRIDRYLGSTARTSTYKAAETPSENTVSIRILNPDIAADPTLRAQFLENGRKISRLDHPYIMKTQYANMAGNVTFMVMDYIDVGNLDDLITRRREDGTETTVYDAVELISQIANGLHYAHQQSLLYNNLRPKSIMLKQEHVVGAIYNFTPVLTEFTLMHLANNYDIIDIDENADSLTYMAPERIRREHIDIRSNVYELGVMLFELLAGRPPFQPLSVAEAVRMHSQEDVPTIASMGRQIPTRLEEVVQRALAKNPNERYQTAEQIERDLREIAERLQSPDEVAAAEDNIYQTDPMPQALAGQMPWYAPPLPDTEMLQDRLIFYRATSTDNSPPIFDVPMDRSVFTVGRSPDSHIQLLDNRVSYQHVRIERMSESLFRIMDVGSKNGTWLGNYRLLRDVAEIWDPAETVRIGGFWVRIETVTMQQAVRSRPALGATTAAVAIDDEYSTDAGDRDDVVIPARPTLPPPEHDNIGVSVDTETVNVTPGLTAGLSIEVQNLSERVDHFLIELVGLPHEWYSIGNDEIYLMPGNRETTSVTFHPPHTSNSIAGAHLFEIRVGSRAQQIHAVRTQVSLIIDPFQQYTSDIAPTRIRGRGQTSLVVTNRGNTYSTYIVKASDEERALKVDLPGTQYTLAPGSEESIPIAMKPRRRKWFGASQTIPYQVNITPSSESDAVEPQLHMGELIQRPTCAIWMIVLAVILCGLLVAGALLGQQAWQTVQELASIPNATATAEADVDGDGLSYLLETELGTFPDLPDTDEDGLTDGEEYRIYGTSPLLRDTDEDGIIDGDEVQIGSNPNLKDTDGDEISDFEDPDPLLVATATPEPTPTPTPIPIEDNCANFSEPPRMIVGEPGQVEPGGVPNRLREGPGTDTEFLMPMPPGSAFDVIGGPTCGEVDKLRWWQINFEGTDGWTAEGEEDAYYICPPDDCAEAEEGDGGGDGGDEGGGDNGDVAAPDGSSAFTLELPADSGTLNRDDMGVQIVANLPSSLQQTVLDNVGQLGIGWVKIQVRWSEMQPDGPNQTGSAFTDIISTIQLANQQGFDVLVSVVKAPEWARSLDANDGPPDAPGAFGDFIDTLLAAGGESIAAVEVWNEPNISQEWTGQMPFSGAGYMTLFDTAYQRIRAYSADMIVITAGLSPTYTSETSVSDRDFLWQMYEAGLADYENIAIGIHPYGWANAPDAVCCEPVEGRGWDDQPEFFFLENINAYRNITQAAEHDVTFWITEFGWSSWGDLSGPAPEGWQSYLTPDEMATYLRRGFEIGSGYDFIGPMMAWNYNYADPITVSTGEAAFAGFSLVTIDENNNLHPRAALEALRP